MFWIYCTWNFILAGLQITYIHQFFPTLARERRLGLSTRTPLADLNWVLPLGVLLYQRFQVSLPTSADDAAESLGLPGDIADLLLKALHHNHLVHAVDHAGPHEAAAPAYTLARPPEQITAQDLLTAARALCPPLQVPSPADVTPPDTRPLPALAAAPA